MSDEVQVHPQTTQPILLNAVTNDSNHINLNSSMSSPRVLLTRIDISSLPLPVERDIKITVASPMLKKKSVGKAKNTKTSTGQQSKVGKVRGRPKNSGLDNLKAKSKTQNIFSAVKSPTLISGSHKDSVKNMLSKTSIKNKSPQIKNPEQIKKNNTKKTKRAPIKKMSIPKLKNVSFKKNITPRDTDSSEGEYLYDELIEDLESSAQSKAGVSYVKPVVQKTNKIMLKPSSGNKGPTIMKGGIIKRTKLPSELQSIPSLNTKRSNSVKELSGSINTQPPTRKSSPWSISMSPKAMKGKQRTEEMSSSHNISDSNPPRPLKPRTGPKQTLKVGPLFNSSIDDNNSDEYTEIETLENDDCVEITYSTSFDSSSKKNTNQNSPPKPTFASCSKGDEDPNLDLIRILSDETDDPVEQKSTINSDINGENKHKPKLSQDNPSKEDAPPVRTVYDLMNEISLEHPSWNLHIVPETNAFCIAQITKGRLGIPTMKKCIELDSLNFFGRVFIHQYHIKKYDGVYDSEEGILGLFHEIHSIKA